MHTYNMVHTAAAVQLCVPVGIISLQMPLCIFGRLTPPPPPLFSFPAVPFLCFALLSHTRPHPIWCPPLSTGTAVTDIGREVSQACMYRYTSNLPCFSSPEASKRISSTLSELLLPLCCTTAVPETCTTNFIYLSLCARLKFHFLHLDIDP